MAQLFRAGVLSLRANGSRLIPGASRFYIIRQEKVFQIQNGEHTDMSINLCLTFFFNNWDYVIDRKRLSNGFEKESDVLTMGRAALCNKNA